MAKQAPRSQPKPSARASRTTTARPKSTNGSQQEETDEDGDEATIPVDDDLVSFLESPAMSADRVVVLALSPGGDVIVQDRTTTEAKHDPDRLALAITIACERWAKSERRLVRFRAAWMRGDRTLATHAWECGRATQEQPVLDGSAQSFLVQQQHQQLAQHKLHLEGFEMVQESWKNLLNLQNKRIESLERTNDELRERLQKIDDASSEIALEQAKAELEQRGRTADLIEHRLLPIAHAFVVKKLESEGAAAAAAPIAHGENKNSDNKQASP